MFLEFFLLSNFEPLLPKWQRALKTKASPLSGMPDIAMSLFVGWLVLWLPMMAVRHLSHAKKYWINTPVFTSPLFSEWGTPRYFEELLSAFCLPEHGPGDPEYVDQDPLQSVRKWFDLLAAFWRTNYKAASIPVEDETMVVWTSQGAHLTYLPRKPTPLGIMLKTICDASSRVLLGREFCEGKEGNRLKR
jgi:hypothetical protein